MMVEHCCWCPGDGHVRARAGWVGRGEARGGQWLRAALCSIAVWGEGVQHGAGTGGGLGELSQSMLLLIPRCSEARIVPHVLQAKPNPCVNGLGAASHVPHLWAFPTALHHSWPSRTSPTATNYAENNSPSLLPWQEGGI